MAKLPMMGTGPVAGLGRGKPGAPTQNAAGVMGQRRPRSAAMIGRMARQGMPSQFAPRPGPGASTKPAPKPVVQKPSARVDMRQVSTTPNYTPSAAQMARNRQESAARTNTMSPVARLSQNAPKFKG